MKKIFFIGLLILALNPHYSFAQFGAGPFGDVSGSGSGLEDCTESGEAITCPNGFNAGAAADPKLQLTPSTDNDTRFYACIDSDAGNDDDDVFTIGDGTVCGTNSFMKIETDGDFQTLNSVTGINDSNTGMFFPGSDVLDLKAGGTILFKLSNPGSSVARGSMQNSILSTQISSETCTDSGDGSPGALTSTPGNETGFRMQTQSDADGCNVTIADTNAAQGDFFVYLNNATNTMTLLHQNGVLDIGSNALYREDMGSLFIFDGAEYIPIGGNALLSHLYITAKEGLDATIELKADDNDDANDKIILRSTASDNDFDILNNTTTILSVTSTGELTVPGISSDGSGKTVCIKSDGRLGTCSSVVGADGTCTCG